MTAPYALHVTAQRRVTGPTITATCRETLAQYGIPASTLTDDMVYTVRLRGGRNTFEHELPRLHIVQKNSRASHPTTLREGREIPADDEELAPPPTRSATTLTQRRAFLDAFVEECNHHRPHRSLPTTPPQRPRTTHDRRPARQVTAAPPPTTASAEPTPEPASSCSSTTYTSASSTPTGELLRELIVDSKNYQPKNPPK
jgi:hypothetical protein